MPLRMHRRLTLFIREGIGASILRVLTNENEGFVGLPIDAALAKVRNLNL
jgi:hypothetical protein